MRILIVSAHLPSPRARQGGQKTSYHFCRYLAEKHDLDLLTFATTEERQTYRAEDMAVFRLVDIVPVSYWTRLKGLLGSPRLPLSVAARFSRRFQEKLQDFLESTSYEAAILDHVAIWQYAEMLSSVPLVVGSAHDVLAQLWERKYLGAKDSISRVALRFEHQRILRWESKQVSKLDLVVPHSRKDADLYEQMVPTVPRFPINPWSEIWAKTYDRDQNQVVQEGGSIVFWGAMDRSENRDALAYALSEILPRVRKKVPDVPFYVVGNGGEKLSRMAGGTKNVIFTGFVEDPSLFLSRMQVALLPVRFGAGIKIKTLECMGYGVPVVGTPIAVEGIQGENGTDFLVADTAEDLAECVIHLLQEPQAARRIGQRGRKMVLSRHDFSTPMELLIQVLNEGVQSRGKSSREGLSQTARSGII